MTKLGVIGSGTMGSGIAQTAAQNGYDVKLFDVVPAQLNKARTTITTALGKRVDNGKLTQQEMDDILARISSVAELEALSDREIIVEAVPEKLELKQQTFKQVESIALPDALLASNTSSISIGEIAGVLQDPSRLVGIHFFNPVPAMKLVEIVSSLVVRPEAVEAAAEFAVSLGKETIMAKDTPGFVVNYLQYPFRLNAIRMVESGMATKEDIDKGAKLGLGHPMGPLELQDLVGLDVTYNAVKAIYDESKDPSFAPPILLKRMVEAGLLGRKTGKGFYTYPDKK